MEYVLRLVSILFGIVMTFVSVRSYPFFNQVGDMNVYSLILASSFQIYSFMASLVKVGYGSKYLDTANEWISIALAILCLNLDGERFHFAIAANALFNAVCVT